MGARGVLVPSAFGPVVFFPLLFFPALPSLCSFPLVIPPLTIDTSGLVLDPVGYATSGPRNLFRGANSSFLPPFLARLLFSSSQSPHTSVIRATINNATTMGRTTWASPCAEHLVVNR